MYFTGESSEVFGGVVGRLLTCKLLHVGYSVASIYCWKHFKTDQYMMKSLLKHLSWPTFWPPCIKFGRETDCDPSHNFWGHWSLPFVALPWCRDVLLRQLYGKGQLRVRLCSISSVLRRRICHLVTRRSSLDGRSTEVRSHSTSTVVRSACQNHQLRSDVVYMGTAACDEHRLT